MATNQPVTAKNTNTYSSTPNTSMMPTSYHIRDDDELMDYAAMFSLYVYPFFKNPREKPYNSNIMLFILHFRVLKDNLVFCEDKIS